MVLGRKHMRAFLVPIGEFVVCCKWVGDFLSVWEGFSFVFIFGGLGPLSSSCRSYQAIPAYMFYSI